MKMNSYCFISWHTNVSLKLVLLIFTLFGYSMKVFEKVDVVLDNYNEELIHGYQLQNILIIYCFLNKWISKKSHANNVMIKKVLKESPNSRIICFHIICMRGKVSFLQVLYFGFQNALKIKRINTSLKI